MRAQEAGGSRCCAAVRCVSCVQSSDTLAEPPNTDATRPWPRGEAGLHRLVGSGSSPLEAKDVCVVGEVRVKAANTCFAVQGGKRRTDDEKERQHGDEEAECACTVYRPAVKSISTYTEGASISQTWLLFASFGA